MSLRSLLHRRWPILAWAGIWAAALAAAFSCDRWIYQHVSRWICVRIGFKPWRFGLSHGDRAPDFEEILLLLKRMGHAYFFLLVSITILVLAPGRRRQVWVLWLCIGAAVVLGQGVVRPLIGKLRPDAPLSVEQAARVRSRLGPIAVVKHWAGPGLEYANTGYPLTRRGEDGLREAHALTLPSGHAILAFAAFAALAACFRRGRWWFFLLACGVAASRVAMGDHFLSDVIAGGGLGYACAAWITSTGRVRRFAGLEA